MITLDKRLLMLAEDMTPGGFGVDVGTDHGYLAVYLVQSGKASRMLATDVNLQPLQSAERCIAENGLSDRISTRLTDGLAGLDLTEVTDIFIAGMGGILISEILSARHPLSQKLVLQPMTQAPMLRQWLCEKGYRIERERCAVSAGKAYSVITARHVGEKQPCDPLFALVGEAAGDISADGDAYLKKQLDRLERKADGMRKADAADESELAETDSLIAGLRTVIEKRKERKA